MVNSKIAKQAIPQFLDISMNEFFSEYIHTVSNVACVLRLPLKKKKKERKKIRPVPATWAISNIRVNLVIEDKRDDCRGRFTSNSRK